MIEEKGSAENMMEREVHEFISFTRPIAILPLIQRLALFRLQRCFVYDFNCL